MKIREKILLSILIMMILGTGVLVAELYFFSLKHVILQATQEDDTLSDSIHEAVYGFMKTGQQQHLDGYLEKVRTLKNIDEIRVIRAPLLEEELGIKPASRAKDDLDRQVLWFGQRIHKEERVRRSRAIRTISPVLAEKSCLACHTSFKEGDVMAALSMTLDFQASLDQMVRNTIHTGIIQGLILLIILGVVYVLLNRCIMKPMSELGVAARKFGSGDFKAFVRLKTKGKKEASVLKAGELLLDMSDEFGELAGAFNEMAQDLQKVSVSREELQKEIESRAKVSEALAESEKRFMDVLYASREAMLIIREDKFVDANDATARMLGYSTRQEFLEKHPSELSPPVQPDGRNSFEKAGEMMRIAFETGYQQFEWMHRRASGEEFPVRVSLTPITLHGQKLLYCVWKDLTLEKKSEERIREQTRELAESLKEAEKSQEVLVSMMDDNNQMRARFEQSAHKLESILASAGEGILGLDSEGRHIFSNPQALKMLGYTEAEMIGKKNHDLVHHSHPDGSPYPVSECSTHAVLKDGKPRHGEEYYWRKDGTGFPVEYTAVPLLEDGKNCGIVISFADISERKQAGEALRQGEERLRSITDSAQDAILMMNPLGAISFWNPAAERIFGYTAEEAIGKDLHSFLAPERFREAHAAAFPEFLKTGKGGAVGKTLELGAIRKDGTEISVSLSLSAVKRSDGWHAVGLLSDITERKIAAERLRMSEEKFRTIFDNSAASIILADGEEHIVSWNKFTERLLGMDKSDLFDKPVSSLYPAEEWARMRSLNIRAKGMKEHLETLIYHKDRSLIEVDLSISVLKNAEGRIIGSIGLIHDITDRKKAEGELRKFQRAIEQSPATVVITDFYGTIEYVNPRFTAVTGYSYDEALGKNPRILKSGEMPVEFYKQMWETITTGKEWRGEFHNKKKNGELFWESASISPLRNAQGIITHFLAVKEDITEQKKAQELMKMMMSELHEARVAAEIANKAKSMFLANMSHEIRTPMNAIIGFSELLAQTPLGDEQRNYVDTMCLSGRLLLELVNDILDFSKIEAGKVALEEIDFNLEYLCKDAFNIASTRFKGKKINAYVDFDKDVPVHLKGDPTRIRQILINLLSNAAKFTEKGEIGIRVRVLDGTASSEEPVIEVTVKDTGIGIAQEKTEKLFSRFTQVDMSTTRKYGGTGLGLSICKALVERMGGRIWVESKEHEGSEFKFTAKLKKGTLPVESKITPLDKKSLVGKTVFIVDDNEHALEITRRHCLDIGLSVVAVAMSGAEAFRFLTQAAADGCLPALVLSDIRMENMDGYELVQKLKEAYPKSGMRFIAVPSDIWAGSAKESEKCGFNGYLPKPVFKDDLARVIATVLGDQRDEKNIITRHRANELAFKGMRVLVVEDAQTNQLLIKAILNKWGCEVDFANNGKEGVEKLRANKYDICLMDLQMPVMGGLEATQIIREEISKDFPVIALTAAALDEDRLKCLAGGMTDYISKPIDVDMLKDKLIRYGRPV